MAAYATMLLNRGAGPNGRVLDERSFERLITPVQQADSWGKGTSYGYGFAVNQQDGRTVIRHTGGMIAFSSALHADLTSGVAAFASMNAMLQPYRPNDVVSYALDLLRAADSRKALPPVPAPEQPLVVTNASDYAGNYVPASGRAWRVVAEGNQLLVYPHGVGGQASRLQRMPGDDSFTLGVISYSDDGKYPLHFFRDKNNVVTELFYGPEWMPNERYTGPKQFEYPKEWEAFAGDYRNDDPWQGLARVWLRKGKLWLGGDAIVPMGNGLFRPDQENSPERISFDTLISGKAQRMNFSGVDFYRIERS
jgi:D-alanyl-D-alanine carboxypeptidase